VLTNGRQALDWLEHQPADLVLMDCEMPEMDGIEATGRIRARERATGKPPVRIVALTANGMETYVERCVAAGMNDHLSKPFRPDELERTLSRHIRLGTTQR
jgi:CheY-like chemotaxis protein